VCAVSHPVWSNAMTQRWVTVNSNCFILRGISVHTGVLQYIRILLFWEGYLQRSYHPRPKDGCERHNGDIATVGRFVCFVQADSRKKQPKFMWLLRSTFGFIPRCIRFIVDFLPVRNCVAILVHSQVALQLISTWLLSESSIKYVSSCVSRQWM
jgi:hypothetical protein